MKKHLLGLAASAALLLSISSANAAFIITSVVGGGPEGTINDNLNALLLGPSGGVTATGIVVNYLTDAATVQGAAAGLYAAPVLSNNNGALFGDADGVDASRYITTGSTGAFAGAMAEMLLPVWSNYMGLLWGSVDRYNELTFYDGNTLVGTITGVQVNAAANGDQGALGTFYVNITSDILFNRVVAKSSQYAFEFDNLSFKEVPEPMTLGLLGAGLMGLGLATRRRKTQAIAS